MEKTQGATLGTVLLAALLLRPGVANSPEPKTTETPGAVIATSLQGKAVNGDGPWVASCEFWAPERAAPTGAAPSETIVAESTDPNGSLSVHATVAEEESDCKVEPDSPKNSQKWGIPAAEALASTKRRITAMIATVPDPIRTNLALQFDWTIDAMLDAAADNGYVSTYYWLPWGDKAGAGDGEHKGRTQSGLERQPGLIILKPFQPANDQELHSAVYLFLVAETPTSGINGYEIERAFDYEDALESSGLNLRRSLAGDANEVDIIGPTFSASASSLRRAIDYQQQKAVDKKLVFKLNGATMSSVAADDLNHTGLPENKLCNAGSTSVPGKDAPVQYASFDGNSDYIQGQVLQLLRDANAGGPRVALLIEDGTTLGESNKIAEERESKSPGIEPIVIRFPREISLLRNAETEEAPKPGVSPPSPYLRFSLKDSNAYDGVPHFSREDTPLIQESELMAIVRQLQHYRAEYVVISATNPLDQFYLGRVLHRSLPNARLMFDGPNTLFVRDVDDEPFIGSLAFGAYHLIGLGNATAPGFGGRAFSGVEAISYYNAVSMTFWNRQARSLRLVGYMNPLHRGDQASPPLWMSIIGSDGYYPLGVASPQATGEKSILPQQKTNDLKLDDPKKFPLFPAFTWSFLCFFVTLACITHIVAMGWAEFWSPATRDLALRENDQPYRRCLYIRVGAVMLCAMAMVTAIPLFRLAGSLIEWHWTTIITGVITFLAGVAVMYTTGRKTHRYLRHGPPIDHIDPERSKADAIYYRVFCTLTWVALFVIPATWLCLCIDVPVFKTGSSAGICFAYRCLHPQSGVSPLVPVILLLAAWYLWSVFQALRLRFSECNRPMLPGGHSAAAADPYPLYTADQDMEGDDKPWTGCLYRNITALLITREVIMRFVRNQRRTQQTRIRAETMDRLLKAGYVLVFFAFVTFPLMYSVDRVLLRHWWFSPFDFLLRALFFPLLVIAATGCLRLVVVWGALKRGLLEYMENSPLRFAFTRLKGSGWKSMFRQSGLREQWRDMARSVESARQLVMDEELQKYAHKLLFEGKDVGAYAQKLGIQECSLKPVPIKPVYDDLEHNIRALMRYLYDKTIDQTAPGLKKSNGDPCSADPAVTKCKHRSGLRLMHAIEANYADFARVLLEYVLIPRWKADSRGFVQSESAEALLKPNSEHKKPECESGEADTPHCVQLAEEFVAIRYLSLIRTVLVNLRYLMTFVTVAFVLAIIAWNSYPFEPREIVNWLFTILLVLLGVCIVMVFAQMHRDPILSRITDKRPNELGWEFYLRVASFGVVPVLTWLAYNYPQIGVTLYQLFQTGGGAK